MCCTRKSAHPVSVRGTEHRTQYAQHTYTVAYTNKYYKMPHHTQQQQQWRPETTHTTHVREGAFVYVAALYDVRAAVRG